MSWYGVIPQDPGSTEAEASCAAEYYNCIYPYATHRLSDKREERELETSAGRSAGEDEDLPNSSAAEDHDT